MSESTKISVNTATRSSSVNHLTLANLFVNQYECEGLTDMPFDPAFDSVPAPEGGVRTRPFGDIVVDVHSFADNNFESVNIVAGRYITCVPRKVTSNVMRDIHVVAHRTPSQQSCVTYTAPETTATMSEDFIKGVPPGWKALYQADGVFTEVTIDTLYYSLLERAMMCSFSLRMNNPANPLVIADTEWSDTSVWTTHGGQLRAGPQNNDPAVNVALVGRIPIHLPSNLRLQSVLLGLTLLAVCARSHFYPIVNGGNSFSNHCVATPGSVIFLASTQIPPNLPQLDSGNIVAALRQLAIVCDYLGISSQTFTDAAASAIRAAWVLPDTYSIPSLFEDAHLNDVNAVLRSDADIDICKRALENNTFSTRAAPQAYLIAQFDDLEAGLTDWYSIFLRCDSGALDILAYIKANPTIADNPAGTVIDAVDRYAVVPIHQQQYIRPISYLGHRVQRSKFGWMTHLYLSHIQKKKADSLSVTGIKIDVSWLPKYTLKFLGGVCALLACAQSVAINQAPITRFNNVGNYGGIINNTLSNLEVDSGNLTTPSNSTTSFTATLSINQMYMVGFTVVPGANISTTLALPVNTSQRFGEAIITLADPKFTLSATGAWTPQLPYKMVGVNRAYTTFVLPNLRNIDFINDGIVDIRILMYRVALFHRLTPQFAELNTFTANGELDITLNTPIYTPQYLGVIQGLPELIPYLVPVFNFDKFVAPAQKHNVVRSAAVYASTDKLDITKLRFYVGAYPSAEITPVIPMITPKARQQLTAMLKAITITPVVLEPLSQNQIDAKKKLGQSSDINTTGGASSLDPNLINEGLSELSLKPNDSASQSGQSDPTIVNLKGNAPKQGGFH